MISWNIWDPQILLAFLLFKVSEAASRQTAEKQGWAELARCFMLVLLLLLSSVEQVKAELSRNR